MLGCEVMYDVGIFKSLLCGTDAVDSPRLFKRKTRMIVMMSSIAVMLRKLTSCSCALRRMARRSSALYLAIDAFGALDPGPGPCPCVISAP
jgi:hypothetical protein